MKTTEMGNGQFASPWLLLLIIITTLQCKPLHPGSANQDPAPAPNEKTGLYLGKAQLIRQSYEENL